MSISSEQLQAVAVGSQENRVEALRLLLGYPLKQRDPEGSRFWFLRPGGDPEEAEDTCPIAVGFYSELNHLSKAEIPQFLTADEQQKQIYGHYTQRIVPNQPVMYLLLPEGETPGGKTWQSSGRVAMILPSEGKLRQRQIQTFAWTEQDLQARLFRLQQTELARTDRMQEKALSVIPLVEWAFYKPIETAKELATKLAEVSRKIEQAIPAVYIAERSDGYLHSLLTSFQRELLPTLKLKADNDKDYSFADIYAQTIAYGLFTARVFSYTVDERKRQEEQNPGRKETDFNRQNAWELLPETNPFLRRLFKDVSQQPVAELGEDLLDAISEVFSILRAAKMEAILADFRAKMNREDIVIRFYEDFLAAYKPKMRERRGVYYTPEPVVSYMVRSVDILLKEKFAKPLGLADPEVMILDPACGTGTFLLWIFQLIYQRFQENSEALTAGLEDKSWSGYVKERLLPRVFGFELLMAPYAIAHLKLGLFLEETGYQFDGGKRLGVYLTNTLEDYVKKSETLFEEFIADESDQAASIKRDKPVMVVIGNPPYSIRSQNLTPQARTWVDAYRVVDGSPIKEKGALQFEKNLQDDYIKFIRFAQWRIEQTNYGIIAFVSNHTYLDSPTFRGMRQSLMQTFDTIHLLDLNGSSKKKGRNPHKSKDENVFDIQQGVSINLSSRYIRASEDSNSSKQELKYCQLWGARETPTNSILMEEPILSKYQWLTENSVSTTHWSSLSPRTPYYLFEPLDTALLEEYETAWKVSDIMPLNSTGVKTHRDHFAFSFDRSEMCERLEEFRNLDATDESISQKYDLKDTYGWTLSKGRRLLAANSEWEKHITLSPYRPFDFRYYFYSKAVVELPRHEVMRHTSHEGNIGLCTTRQINGDFRHVLCTEYPVTDCSLSNATRERTYFFPLFVYPDKNALQKSILQEQTRVNFSDTFLREVETKLGYAPSLRSLFYYIYALLHSPTYRTRYAEFLKIDFPRVPLTSNDELFRQLSSYGEELVALHLMKSSKLDNLITKFVETSGNCIVDPGHPKYDENFNSVLINKKGDKFTGVPKAVWEFYVGGYQVCHKWLKDRKGRTLSEADITHYQRIIVALQETIHLMQKIDEAIPGFPLE